jgi:hypothetical protein
MLLGRWIGVIYAIFEYFEQRDALLDRPRRIVGFAKLGDRKCRLNDATDIAPRRVACEVEAQASRGAKLLLTCF